MKRQLLLFLLFFCFQNVFATKISGTIKNLKGEPMSYSSIVVKGTSTGTMANVKGEYVIDLKPATYELIFQFLGYKSLTKTVVVSQQDIVLNVVLEEQLVNLAEVKVGVGSEDAAYTIMRKAIAKSKIHTLQVTNYEANAYIKSTILLKSIPFFAKKSLEKSGLKEGVPFISESILAYIFKQPNSRITKVIAKKTTKIDNLLSIEDGFYLVNFYRPTFNDVISPLSPNAFNYYKFEYKGFFEERGMTVNKISVIPKVFGANVWRGEIYIFENFWNIHSINVETMSDGVSIKINQIYAPIQQVWMPINQRISVAGSVFGFDFSMKSQVNATYISLQTNPEFVEEIKLIDEKKEGKKAVSISKKAFSEKSSAEILAVQKDFSLKELNRLMREHEKEELKRKKENGEDIHMLRNDSVIVDSMASKRTADYWATARTIPLTSEEIKGYHFTDSIKVAKIVNKDSLKKDSLRKSWKYFILGHDFKFKNSLFLKYMPPYMPFVGLNYNTVEGLVANLGLTLHRDFNKNDPNQLLYKIATDFRYGFGSQKFLAKTEIELKQKGNTFSFGGGKNMSQFDTKSGYFDILNTITTMLSENISKIYQKDYFHLGYAYEQDKRLRFSSDVEYAKRSQLNNLPDNKLWFKNENRPFSSNSPTNIELGNTNFQPNNALTWNTVLSWQPGLNYHIYNGKKIYYNGKLPTFSLNYRKGMVDVNYDFLSLKVVQEIRTGWAGKLNYYVEAGDYLNAKTLLLMDMKHLNSLNWVSSTAVPDNLFARYRLLETNSVVNLTAFNHYLYSTKGAYVKAHVINEFNNLLITQLPMARIYGLKEDIFVNYLTSPSKNNYVEIGYGIDGIFKVLRLELISSFEAGKYQRWGWQIGSTF